MQNDSSYQPEILVVDDSSFARDAISQWFRKSGYKVIEASSGNEAQKMVSERTPLVILDIKMSDGSGIECLKFIKKEYPRTEIIMLSSVKDVPTVVETLQAGAFWYLTKPVKGEELLALSEKAIQTYNLSKSQTLLKAAINTPPCEFCFNSFSNSSKELITKIDKVSNSDSTVLISGETGSGKSSIARMIHNSSDRVSGPFISINSADLPRSSLEMELFGGHTPEGEWRPGKIELANGGTLVIEQIEDFPIELQSALLTLLEKNRFKDSETKAEKTCNIRVIVTASQNLEELLEEKRLREDLYFRIKVLHIEIPPLRKRVEDIIPIAEDYLEKISTRLGVSKKELSETAKEKLKKYRWPGNIRELENTLEQVVTLSNKDVITSKDLSFIESKPPSDDDMKAFLGGFSLRVIERKAIIDNIQYCAGNKAKTAKVLGISEKSIYNKMERLGILPEDLK